MRAMSSELSHRILARLAFRSCSSCSVTRDGRYSDSFLIAEFRAPEGGRGNVTCNLGTFKSYCTTNYRNVLHAQIGFYATLRINISHV
jgi:hypothetical protein